VNGAIVPAVIEIAQPSALFSWHLKAGLERREVVIFLMIAYSRTSEREREREREREKERERERERERENYQQQSCMACGLQEARFVRRRDPIYTAEEQLR